MSDHRHEAHEIYDVGTSSDVGKLASRIEAQRQDLRDAGHRISVLEQDNQRLGAELAELRAEVRADLGALREAGAR